MKDAYNTRLIPTWTATNYLRESFFSYFLLSLFLSPTSFSFICFSTLQGAMQKAYRTVKLNYTPKCAQERRMDEKYSYRPQANFLHPVPDYGQIQPVHQHHRSRRP
jgi:hypothetical protein